MMMMMIIIMIRIIIIILAFRLCQYYNVTTHLLISLKVPITY